MGEDRYQSAMQYNDKYGKGRYTEITPQEVEDNNEYRRLLGTHREGAEMLDEYIQE